MAGAVLDAEHLQGVLPSLGLSDGRRLHLNHDECQDVALAGNFLTRHGLRADGTRLPSRSDAKPTIAAVHGWCIAGGTDLVLCADIVIAAENAVLGYPPSRVWGTPTTAMWVYRMGFEKAKRYLLTGDEIPAKTAADIGLILETVPDERDNPFGDYGSRPAHS